MSFLEEVCMKDYSSDGLIKGLVSEANAKVQILYVNKLCDLLNQSGKRQPRRNY